MGLRDTVQMNIAKAFDTKLADAVSAITVEQNAVTFDPFTNSVIDNFTYYTSRGVVGNYLKASVENLQVEPNDIKITILQHELATIPEIDDIVIVNTIRYRVLNVRQDPVQVTWTLQCRV